MYVCIKIYKYIFSITLFYYKMWQKFIEKCVRCFVIKCDSFITKCNSYYKLSRFCYKLRQFLQNATFVTTATVQTSAMTADKCLDI